jgi:hypothetical protein
VIFYIYLPLIRLANEIRATHTKPTDLGFKTLKLIRLANEIRAYTYKTHRPGFQNFIFLESAQADFVCIAATSSRQGFFHPTSSQNRQTANKLDTTHAHL